MGQNTFGDVCISFNLLRPSYANALTNSFLIIHNLEVSYVTAVINWWSSCPLNPQKLQVLLVKITSVFIQVIGHITWNSSWRIRYSIKWWSPSWSLRFLIDNAPLNNETECKKTKQNKCTTSGPEVIRIRIRIIFVGQVCKTQVICFLYYDLLTFWCVATFYTGLDINNSWHAHRRCLPWKRFYADLRARICKRACVGILHIGLISGDCWQLWMQVPYEGRPTCRQWEGQEGHIPN